ncbi:uncharacterized protein ACHE_21319A [Aspergillus chevalieri]|uniref:Uncharacterized protein n=1 Tax=Aspergillus chevalieri TaxID=182096 RepID=A0A7R7VJI4_ASPCH|nr:uncharacterized protein ACHE_21319A [Aspergillus chevalieri]BCR85861.1 hypothetical protein ACHE_21319A [Aspergillus chevalieri]
MLWPILAGLDAITISPILRHPCVDCIHDAQSPKALISKLHYKKARRDCRLQTIRIVKEANAVSDDPTIAIDFNRVGVYLTPALFRQLLLGSEPRATKEEIKQTALKYEEVEAKTGEWEKPSRN